MSNNFEIIDFPKIFNILKSMDEETQLKNEEYINLMIKLIKKNIFLVN